MSKNTPNYSTLPLKKEDLLNNPIDQFHLWFQQAQGEVEPSAMTLATVDHTYHVSARMVLLKSYDQKGFSFFTNYLSPKAKCLEEIANAALVFWWPICQRQIRITGTVTRLNKADSNAYFQQRSKDSRIAAIISKQSEVIPDRDHLLDAFNKAQALYAHQEIECPDYWGGYILQPLRIEFWQSRSHRLHDRFEYRLNRDHIWEIVQLSP